MHHMHTHREKSFYHNIKTKRYSLFFIVAVNFVDDELAEKRPDSMSRDGYRSRPPSKR